MKARKVIDLSLLLMILIFGGYFFYTRYFTPPQIPKQITKQTFAREILKYKTVITPNIINNTLTSAACTNFLKISAEETLSEYTNEIIDHKIDNIVKTCQGAIPSLLQSKIDEAILKCKDSTHEQISNECLKALLAAKTSSLLAIVKPEVDPSELNASILLQLIAEKFSSGDFFEKPDKSSALVDALIEKEPNFIGGYKAKLMLLSMSSLNKEEHSKDLFFDTLEDAQRLDPKDRDIKELEIAERGDIFSSKGPEDKSKDKTEFLEYLEKEKSLYPNEWIYDYYKAQTIYNNGLGDYSKSLSLLESTYKKFPNANRIKLSIENLKSDDEQRRLHPFSFSVGFSLEDL